MLRVIVSRLQKAVYSFPEAQSDKCDTITRMDSGEEVAVSHALTAYMHIIRLVTGILLLN